MAKKAWKERNKRKAETVKKFAALRAELKAKRDYAGLAKLPRDASPSERINIMVMTTVTSTTRVAPKLRASSLRMEEWNNID